MPTARNSLLSAPASGKQISPCEKQILKLISDGFTNQEISEFLILSARTVEAQRRNLMLKLRIFDLASLMKNAIREKITKAN